MIGKTAGKRSLGMWHVYLKGEFYGAIRWGNLQESGHLEGLGVDGSIILNFILKKKGERSLTGFMCLRRMKYVGYM